MNIEKNEKKYEVIERKKYWSVVWKSGAVNAEFKVPKDICKTESELKEYIEKETMF